MVSAQRGNTVTVSYVGTLDNGRIFASTDECGPLTFALGTDQVFPALEQAILDMRPGETKNVRLTVAEAYGERLQEQIIQVARHALPAGKEISVGQKLSIEFKGGTSRVMLVTEVLETSVTLDGNHPLAGCELTFALRLDEVA